MPTTDIMLIRHAEKPDDEDSGVDKKGNPDKHDLIVRGWQRAGALVQFFANPRDPNGPIKRPATIFATAPSSQSASKRPLHTVTPLAELLGIDIDSDIAEGAEHTWSTRRLPVPARC
jgi:broad specificity phosphatase PhoE